MNFLGKLGLFQIGVKNVLVIFLALVFQGSSGLQLDVDGGYHLTVGLDAEILDPLVAKAYIDSIETNLKSLGTRMFETSNNQFYLKSVTIVTKPSFGIEDDTIEAALSETFQESDIKISESYRIPDVIRPTQCELPGDEIRLPSSFFNEETDDLYKVKDKALLHLWAQYRWGVFEESGFPGSYRFPYFIKDTSRSEWKANACSDEELFGSYILPDDTSCPFNDVTSPLDSDCRFVPDPDISLNTAKSSIMNNFYWIDSLNSFCTAETHNNLLPNRQNLFCGGRSIMEVIQSCSDWNRVSEPLESVVEPSFRIVKASAKPLVYILLDNRMISIPEGPISKLKAELVKLFAPSTGLENGILTAMGEYPHPEAESAATDFKVIFPWTVLSETVAEKFAASIDSTVSTGKNPDGIFGPAIKEISESIKSRRHEAGALILILKGSPVSNLELMPFEADVIGSLISQKIKLFALEVSTSALYSGENLKNVATVTGGSHILIEGLSDVETKLPEFIKEFIQASKSPDGFNPDSPIMIFKDFISSEVAKNVKILFEDPGQVSLSLTSAIPLNSVKFESSISGDIAVTQGNEWNERNGQMRRITYTGSCDPVVGEVLYISYICPSEVEACDAFLMVKTERSQNNGIDLSVPIGMIDYDFDGLALTYIPIFAHVELNGQPLIDLNANDLEASATLCLQENLNDCWTIPLTDNGAGMPDLLTNDGILSGIFIPSVTGSYRCWVTVSYDQKSSMENELVLSRNEFNDKSVGQSVFPCSLSYVSGCVGVPPPSSFQMVTDLYGVITVINLPTEPALVVPEQILDLSVLYASEYIVILTWTSPLVLDSGEVVTVESYDIRFCLEDIKDPEDCETIDFPSDPVQAGLKETLEYEMKSEETHYFFVRSVYKEITSPISNPISQKPNEDPISIPSTTITTTVPSTMATDTTDTSSDASTTVSVSTNPSTSVKPSTSTASTYSTITSSTSTDSEPIAETSTEPIKPETTPQLLTTRRTGTSQSPATTESSEYFFKKPIGYITAAAIGVVIFALISGAVGYLCWKRNTAMKLSKLGKLTTKGV